MQNVRQAEQAASHEAEGVNGDNRVCVGINVGEDGDTVGMNEVCSSLEDSLDRSDVRDGTVGEEDTSNVVVNQEQERGDSHGGHIHNTRGMKRRATTSGDNDRWGKTARRGDVEPTHNTRSAVKRQRATTGGAVDRAGKAVRRGEG